MCMPKMPWATSPSTTASYGTTVLVPGESVTTRAAVTSSGKALPWAEPLRGGGLVKEARWQLGKSGKESSSRVLST